MSYCLIDNEHNCVLGIFHNREQMFSAWGRLELQKQFAYNAGEYPNLKITAGILLRTAKKGDIISDNEFQPLNYQRSTNEKISNFPPHAGARSALHAPSRFTFSRYLR